MNKIELLATYHQPDYEKRYVTFGLVMKGEKPFVSIGVKDENGSAAVDIPVQDLASASALFDEVRYQSDRKSSKPLD